MLIALIGLQGESFVQHEAVRVPEYFKAFREQQNKGNLSRTVLKNGLTVLIEEQPLDPLVAILIHVKTGYEKLSEEDQQISQLLGQMYAHRSPVVDDINDLGALFRVQTGYDSIVLSTVGPAENLTRLLKLQVDLLRMPNFEEEKIEWEIQALLEKFQTGSVDFTRDFGRQIERSVHSEKGIWSNPNFTWQEPLSFQNIKVIRQKLIAFHAQYYQSANVILSIAGQVRREQVLEKVSEFYGSMEAIQSQKLLQVVPREVPSQSSFRYRHLRGARRHFIRLSYLIPGQLSEDYYPLLLLSYVLGEGHGSLLKRSMLGNQGSVFDVWVKVESFRSHGTFSFFLKPYPKRIDRAEVQVLACLKQLKDLGISAVQSERAKSLLLKDHYKRLQSVEERAHLLAYHQSLGDYLNRNNLEKRLEAITPQQISSVLRRYFSEENLSLFEYFPQSAELRNFTAAKLLEALQVLVKAELKTQSKTLQILPDRKEQWGSLVPQLTPSYVKYALKKSSILRGPDIYFQEEHVLPLVHIGFFFPGGRAKESAKNAGITELMLRVLFRNAAGRIDSWNKLEESGVEITFVNEIDFFGIRGVLLSNQVEAFFKTLLEWVRRPVVTEIDLNVERRRILEILEGEREDPLLVRIDAARKQIFPKHPYGLNRYGTTKSVSSLNFESVQGWLVSQMSNIHPLIVVRGDIKGTSFLQNFISDLSDSKREKRDPIIVESVKSPQNSVLETEGREFLLISKGPSKGSREEAILDVVDTALFGSKGSLAISLRNRQGIIQEIEIVRQAGLNGGLIFTRALATKGQAENMRGSLWEEFDKLGRVPQSKVEFLPILVSVLTRFYVSQQFGEHFIVETMRNLVAGQGPEYKIQYFSRIKNASRIDILSQVKRYFLFEREE